MDLLVRARASFRLDRGSTLDAAVLFSRNVTWLAKRIDDCRSKFDRIWNIAIDLSHVAPTASDLGNLKPIAWIEHVLHHLGHGSPFVLESNRASNRPLLAI